MHYIVELFFIIFTVCLCYWCGYRTGHSAGSENKQGSKLDKDLHIYFSQKELKIIEEQQTTIN